MKRLILLLTVVLAGLQYSAAQQVTVTGIVTSGEDGLPVIGASVIEKGTANGASTNLDGAFSISVETGATLEFTYLGMQPQSRKINGAVHLEIVLETDAVAISEVVVTAMGVRAEKKRLNFAVQNLNSEDLTDKKAPNFVNALQGKIAGLSVTNSSGSPNSGAQVIIRGISSINNSQNNEPLFVLDGVPISGRGTRAADINPNDIESVTVLKGAASSALYGSEGANGVIMITTKRGQIGKVVATANASWQYDVPTRVPKLQSSYAPGAKGFYVDKASGGWGPLLNEGQQTYDNIRGFLNDGFYQKYDVSLTGGAEKFQGYASANYSMHDGVVPNDYLNKFGMLLKGTYQPFKELSLTVLANISEDTYREFDAIGTSSPGMESVYRWPITDDITNATLPNGYPVHRYYSDTRKVDSPVSPLFGRHNDFGINKRMRNILSGQIEWKPVKNLNITGRLGYDTHTYTYDAYKVPRWDDSVIYPNTQLPKLPEENASAAELAQYELDMIAYNSFLERYKNTPYLTQQDIEDMDKDLLGYYNSKNNRSQSLTASALATYKLELPNDFSVDIMVGSEMKMSEGYETEMKGRDFIIPGIYSLSNTNADYVYLSDRTAAHSQKRTFGHFGEIRGDYRGLASLSVTGRWDWSSTIISNPYFYPSVTGGLAFSELFDIQSDVFSYGKLRGNYASVGKDAPPYLYDRRYKQFATYPDNGYGIDPTLSSASRNLQPEMLHSWEAGADLRFFNNRTRLDVAYYSTQVNNQIVQVRVSPASGYILQVRNEGDIRNRGVEFTLGQDIVKNKTFSWIADLSFGLNRGKIVYLPEEVSETTGTQYGDIFTSAYMGQSTTGLSGRTYLRNAEGKIICDANGYPKIDPTKDKFIGNREPKFISGITNTFKYKDWSFAFLFDGRLGGDVANITERGLISSGQSSTLEKYRGRQIVFDGVVELADGTFEPNTTAITLDYKTITECFYNVSSNYIEDGSFIRLSYVTLGYSLPSQLVHKIGVQGLHCSLTASNLLMLTRYTGANPTSNANTGAGGTGSAGIDNYAVPNTTSCNFSISLTF